MINTTPVVTARTGKPNRPPLVSSLLEALKRPGVIVSLGWVVILVVCTSFADQLAPHDPSKQDLQNIYALPSAAHWLGTDNLGRDILSRLMHGGSGALQGALLAVVVALLIGVPLGLLSGYFGGWIDQAVSFYVNVLLSLPGFIIIITVAFVTQNNVTLIMTALGVVFSGAISRLVRGSTQAARNLLYVDSARVSGLGTLRILARHIFPNVTGPLIVQAFLFLSQAFMILASLSFLGLGSDPSSPDWGQLVYQATKDIARRPWLMVPIGLAITLTILAFNQIGTGLREALPQAKRPSMLASLRPRLAGTPVNTPSDSNEPAEAGPSSDAAIVEVRNLTVSFPSESGETAVVDRVSLTVRRGEVLGLVGESGCGKTMTALAIMGLVPAPGALKADALVLDGHDIANRPEKERARLRGSTVAMVGQEPMVALDPCFTAGAALVEALRLHGKKSRAQARTRALELLRKVGIARAEQVFDSYPHQLSGGMAQRVAIALALTGDPRILIADEPTTALDVTIQAEILDLLLDIRDSEGMTIVLVTHDLGVVADICDRVAVMYAGEVIETGSVEQVLASPRHPYTKGLLGAVPDLSLEDKRLAAIPGRVPVPRDWPIGCRFYARCPIAVEACAEAPIRLQPVTDPHPARCIRIDELTLVGGERHE